MDSRPIPDFENYYVYADGRIFNSDTGREMVLSPTMQGEYSVGLMKDGIQYRRSVKVLVAQAFVDGYSEYFDTPILLDGRRDNLNAWNIRWRPRWFAWRYARQFTNNQPAWFYYGPVFDTINEIRYTTIFEAATTNGNLCKDIHDSILLDTRVFPTGEIYTYK